jgi:4-hydroxy-3-polyprenylbenzoate decarboxylase
MKKIVVAITGASGSMYAEQLLLKLTAVSAQYDELSAVMTNNAKTVWQTELGNESWSKMGIKFYEKTDFAAPFASGSAQFDTMIIIPCSMGTLGRIANGVSDELITRTADVMLKERRKLICVVRETPYSLIHLRNMQLITEAGGIICPATPSFYSQPKNVEEVVATVVDRVIDLAGIKIDSYRWGKKN